jgi:hypothetical protein
VSLLKQTCYQFLHDLFACFASSDGMGWDGMGWDGMGSSQHDKPERTPVCSCREIAGSAVGYSGHGPGPWRAVPCQGAFYCARQGLMISSELRGFPQMLPDLHAAAQRIIHSSLAGRAKLNTIPHGEIQGGYCSAIPG